MDGLICPHNPEERIPGYCQTWIINVPVGGYDVDVVALDDLIARQKCPHDQFVQALRENASNPIFEIEDNITTVRQVS